MDAVLTPEKAERQIDRLLADKGEGRFKKLRRQIQDTLQIREGWRVLITLYPNIVHESYDESKKKGVLCGDGPHKSKHKNGLRLIAKNAEITKDESERVFDRLLIPLNEFIRGNNNEQPESDRWTIVDEHVDKFGDHGWCASNYADQLHDAQDHVEMPEFDRHRWKPLSPVDYAPYANRARWVRTPNDAYLTTSLQKRPHKRFWNIFKAALKHRLWGANGAFHPTAMGHAVTADAVYEQLSRLMKERYRVEKDENYEPNTRVSQI